MSVDAGMEMEPKHRLEVAKIMGGLAGLWWNGGVTIDVKFGMLDSIVVLTVSYRSELWSSGWREGGGVS